MNPLVSIIIPVYNGANYLKEAIDSALAQTYKNIEIIVVNDGSNDSGATEAAALSYGDRIKYYSKENGGCASALNYGLSKMTGDWFSWLSHDDVYYPDKVEKEIRFIKDNALDETKSVISCGAEIIDQDGTKVFHPKFKDHGKYEGHRFLRRLLFSPALNGCGMLIPKRLMDKVGFFDARFKYILDFDYWIRIALSGGELHRMGEETLVKNRIHKKQVTVTSSGLHAEELYKAFCQNAQKVIDKNDLEEISEFFVYAGIKKYDTIREELQSRLNGHRSTLYKLKAKILLLKGRTFCLSIAKKIYWLLVRGLRK